MVPVARSNSAYSYTFPSNTLNSWDGITISLSNQPGWLQVDQSGHRLYGTPSSHDLGQSNVLVTFTNARGATTQDVLSLQVVSAPAPKVTSPMISQIQVDPTWGPLYVNSSMRLVIGSQATFPFKTTPLPTLRLRNYGIRPNFAPTLGITPLPQTVQVQVDASDVIGYGGGVTDGFNVTVAAPQVAATHVVSPLLLASGSSETIALPKNIFSVEGQQVDVQAMLTGAPNQPIINVTLSASPDGQLPPPSWISFDQGGWELTCFPAKSDSYGTTAYIVATDLAGNKIPTAIPIVVDGKQPPNVTAQLPDVYTPPSSYFSHQIPLTSLSDQQGLSLSATIETDANNSSHWLQWTFANQTLSGMAPAGHSEVDVLLTAMDKSGSMTTSLQRIIVSNQSANGAPIVPVDVAFSGELSGQDKAIVAIGSAVLGLFFFGTVLGYYCVRRRKTGKLGSEDGSKFGYHGNRGTWFKRKDRSDANMSDMSEGFVNLEDCRDNDSGVISEYLQDRGKHDKNAYEDENNGDNEEEEGARRTISRSQAMMSVRATPQYHTVKPKTSQQVRFSEVSHTVIFDDSEVKSTLPLEQHKRPTLRSSMRSPQTAVAFPVPPPPAHTPTRSPLVAEIPKSPRPASITITSPSSRRSEWPEFIEPLQRRASTIVVVNGGEANFIVDPNGNLRLDTPELQERVAYKDARLPAEVVSSEHYMPLMQDGQYPVIRYKADNASVKSETTMASVPSLTSSTESLSITNKEERLVQRRRPSIALHTNPSEMDLSLSHAEYNYAHGTMDMVEPTMVACEM
ncbi:hypothetical protein BZG36_01296 [Bifiguratus adelaidae]|uniref:Dystroglycan-type cadherin-like domain-containing protein n=1 Tax=Bifiguratus adelaidae TaxID=1938954 RepID=A0A261Y588_9FUNG|nr:hypothetical protein BZG36_01296 [Bifiguratus adelaidae]